MAPREWLDRLVNTCLKLLAAAIAVYLAVRLVESVVWVLLSIGGVVVAAGLVVVCFRRRHGEW